VRKQQIAEGNYKKAVFSVLLIKKKKGNQLFNKIAAHFALHGKSQTSL